MGEAMTDDPFERARPTIIKQLRALADDLDKRSAVVTHFYSAGGDWECMTDYQVTRLRKHRRPHVTSIRVEEDLQTIEPIGF